MEARALRYACYTILGGQGIIQAEIKTFVWNSVIYHILSRYQIFWCLDSKHKVLTWGPTAYNKNIFLVQFQIIDIKQTSSSKCYTDFQNIQNCIKRFMIRNVYLNKRLFYAPCIIYIQYTPCINNFKMLLLALDIY